MDSYQNLLLSDENGSRYAGRIWSDKTVLTEDLKLDVPTDGINSLVTKKSDFLHVFSALGSSLKITQPSQLDVMFLIDISGSMGKIGDGYATSSNFKDSPMYKTIKSVNETIDTLLSANPNSRFGIVVYGATAQVLVPLGHYTKIGENPFLKVEYLNQYGGQNPQGVHFTLTASYKDDKNSEKEYYVDNAGENSNELHGTTGSGNRNYEGTGGQTTGSGTKENPYHVGHITNQQAGLAAAMDQFITGNSETTWKATDGKTYSRIPALIHLSDGQATDLAWIQDKADSDSEQLWKKSINTWNNVNWNFDLAYNSTNNAAPSNQNHYNASQLSGLGNASPLIFQTLMTASYYKSAVDAYYANSGYTDMSGSTPTLNCYSIYASDSSGYTEMEDTQVKGTINAILNPTVYFKDLPGYDDVESSNLSETDSGARFIDTAYELYKLWLEDGASHTFSSKTTSGSNDPKNASNDITININVSRDQLNNGAYSKYSWSNKITETSINKNIYYVPKNNFFNTDFENVGNVLDDIINSAVKNAFVPIGGINDAGTNDSLTFVDPIGQYMEIKNGSVGIDGNFYDMDLLLFGEHHQLKKSAVYDYEFNLTHRGSNHNSNDLNQPFISGWYDKDGNYLEKDGSWEKGDIYYVDSDTIKKYVPNLDENSITDQQQNTIYTLYSFLDDDSNDNQYNPCYEDKKLPFKLSDIRIWVEDTGNFEDESSIGSPDLGFDKAIYVNIPVNALPVEVANIKLGADGKVKSYSTNLKEKVATPFRLFYGVGLQDSIFTEDGLDVDLTKVSQEYIKKNKVDDVVYFYSNYYSNTNYGGYVTDTRQERTRGDAYFSFSPDSSNRYYIYQNSLTLYEMSEDDTKNKDGFYDEINIEDDNEYTTFKKKHPAVSSSNQIKADSWYYIVIDYYSPNKDTIMRTAIPREGKEFGLGENSVNVNVENQLCWYSESRKETRDFKLNSSKPDDGINDWVIATKPGGLRVGDMAQSLKPKTENTTDTAYNYYLPTISQTTESNSDASADVIVINSYLGNNGRLEINDSLLLIAKETETDELGEKTIDKDREFEFTLKIDGHEGDYQAIKTHKNPYSNAWQLRISTIDLLTNNVGFLQDINNKLYVYEDDGKEYYVFIGDNTEVGDTGGKYVFRVYSSVDNDNEVTLKRSGMTTYVEDPNLIDSSLKTEKNKYKTAGGKNTIGSIDFWINKVYLVPVNEVDEGRFKEITSEYKSIDEFVVAHLDSMKEGANELSSNYATETAYLTTEIKFGYSSSNKPATKLDNWTDSEWNNQIENVAKFKLKADEGILLSGLKSSTKYQITENITEKENKERYYFDHIEVNEEAKTEIKDKNVSGMVTANYIDEIVYINKYYAPVELTIGKSVEGLSSNKETEWHFDIKLTPREGIILKDDYNYTVENDGSVEEKESGKIQLKKQEDGSYEGTVTLKHGQRITIHDIPEYTEYVVKEREANSDGYTTKITGETEGTLDSNNPKATIDFKNVKYSKYKLSITKEIEGESAEKDKEWTFEVRLKPASDTRIEDSYTYSGSKSGTIKFSEGENGEYIGEVKLKAGETITIEDIVERTEYTVEEKEINKDRYITLSENTTGTLQGKETEEVKFKNIKYSLHDLTIEKKVTGGAGEKERTWEFEINLTPDDDVIFDTSYPIVGETSIEGVEKAEDGVLKLTKEGKIYKGTIKLKHGQKITIKNIPERTQYSVVEKEANTDEYKTTITGNEEGTLKSAEEKVVFTNRKLSKHNLTITKEVEGALADKEKNWQFKVTLTSNGESELLDSYQYEGSKNGNLTLEENGDGSYSGIVTLKHGETITIKNIPEGTKYRVEEIEANSDGYTTIISSNSKGTLGQDNPNPKVKFNNIKLSKHSLTISKEVTGGAGDKEKEWNFVITLKPREGITLLDSYPIVGRSISETIPSIAEKEVKLKHNSDGTSEINIKLRHGQSIIINDLPEETEYKIEEKEANKEEYITIVEGKGTGKLGEKETDQVKFINKKPSKSDLTITKEVRGGLGDKNKLWTFNVILTPDEYVTLANKYTVEGIAEKSITIEKQSDGSYKGTIKLKSGEKATIKDLPEKTKYKIEEKEANEDGYITTIKGQEGTLNETKQSVEFTNTKLASYDLTIRKKVYGNLGDKEKEWNFKIKLYAPEIKNLQGSYDYEKKEINETEEEKIEKGSIKLQKVDDYYEVEITLKDNEEIVIKDLLEDTRYEIEETEANTEGYETTIEGEASGVLSSKTDVVTFKNVNYSKHDLKIDGKLKGNNTDPNKEWTLDLTIKPDPNANFKDSYVWEDEHGEEHLLELTPNGDGTYSGQLKLKGEESGTIKDLPYGSEYEIKIEEANKDGYKTTFELDHGVLNDDMEIVFINEKNINSPKTLDDIMNQVIMLILSIISIILIGICFKKLNSNN